MGYLSCRADSSVATCRAVGISSASPLLSSSSPVIQHFIYADLDDATSHFADAALVGRGSHGAVYKAVLPSGRAVAVKRPSSPLHREVDNEIRILSTLRSPRIVNLLGYSCPSSDDDLNRPRLLVVEYMPNGTLYELFHLNPRPPGWARRLRLALQIAKALRALHATDPPVIHRDVKSTNILLDANLDARLGDFGLALRVPKSGPGSNVAALAATPPPAGTLGYLDPAYVTPESLSTKTDVFSFGILLLEIMSGRKAIDVAHSPPSVVEWAVPLLRKGKVAALFDPRVPPPRDPTARRDLAALAASCVRSCKERRPSMADIVDRLVALSKAVSTKVWNGLAVVGNPCAVVDVEKTVSKRAAAAAAANGIAASEQDSSSALVFDDDDEVEGPDTGATLQDAAPVASAKKPPRPSRNGKVFSEAGAQERRNLLELMARIDGVAGQRFGITRARTVRATSDHIGKDAVLLLRRNQTVRVVGSEMLSKSEKIPLLDAKVKQNTGKEQEKVGEIQETVEKIQVKAKKIEEQAAKIHDKGEQIQEKEEENLDKAEKTKEKIGQNLDEADKIQENAGRIQDTLDKIQENEAEITFKAEKIQGKTGES